MKQKVTIKFGGAELELDGFYAEATPDRFYERNGDPGTQGEPAIFEVDTVKCDGKDITEIFVRFDEVITQTAESVKKQTGYKYSVQYEDVWSMLSDLAVKQIEQ